MLRSNFAYDLPPELIARHPPAQREAARLLCLDRSTGEVRDRTFSELPSLLQSGDLLVLNDTRVIPARLFGFKFTGGRVEILVERVRDEQHLLAQLRSRRPPDAGTQIRLEGGEVLVVLGREGEFFVLESAGQKTVPEILAASGHTPLPPYIDRPDEPSDRDRYQTVYARRPGAVAAPTAGLHFTTEMLAVLEKAGIEHAFVTLHVGAGTFQPVRTKNIEDHRMHRERVEVSGTVCAEVRAARQRGGRIVSVGTTSVRALESAAAGGRLEPLDGETDLFITPGFKFRMVDAMLTNFHLPESTLLMLVCAFAGREAVLAAYAHAIRERYRFFSYGDAMLIW